ncbi:MAG TPA: fibronectin type III domain-containing protein [Tepidisphaeraceae bacterium]
MLFKSKIDGLPTDLVQQLKVVSGDNPADYFLDTFSTSSTATESTDFAMMYSSDDPINDTLSATARDRLRQTYQWNTLVNHDLNALLTTGGGDVLSRTLKQRFTFSAVVNDDGAVELGWQQLPQASAYRVERAPGDAPTNFSVLDVLAAGEDSYTDSTVQTMSKYVYRVTAVLAGADRVADPEEVVIAPPTPTAMDITLVTSTTAAMVWQAGPGASGPPDGYKIWRFSASDGATLIDTVDGGTLTFTDTGLAPDSQYYYAIQATYQDADSGYGPTAYVRTRSLGAPVPVVNLQADDSPGNAIRLSWSNSSTSAHYHRVERAGVDSGGTGVFVAVALVPGASPSFIDSEVNAGATYKYRLISENSAGESTASAEAVAVAPAASKEGSGGLLPPIYDNGPMILGTHLGFRYSDRARAAVINSRGYNYYANIDKAQDLIDATGLNRMIDVVPAPDGKHGFFHVYKKAGIFSGGEFLGTITFDAADSRDVEQKFLEAKKASDIGYINTMSNDVRELTADGVEVASVFIPGPQDLILGAIVTKAAEKLAPMAIRASWKAGRWVFQRGGRTLVAEEEAKAIETLRNLIRKEMQEGVQELKWTDNRAKHIIRKRADQVTAAEWKAIVAKTGKKGGAAFYKPGTDVELLERYVWKNGIPDTTGRNFKVMEFTESIGASGGQEVRWMRVENSSGTIHGHPIPHDEFIRRTRS